MSEASVPGAGGGYRVPPQAIETEACVLGSMILDAPTIDLVVQVVKAEHFYRPAHQFIFRALAEMREQAKPIDLVLLRDELLGHNQLEKVGGVDYLMALANGVPSAANAEYYAAIVRDKAVLREVIRTGTEMINTAYVPQADAAQVVESAEKGVFAISSENVRMQARTIQDLLQETFQALEKNEGKLITGLATGFQVLDTLTSGLQAGELLILAARPSMGKTSLLLNMMEHMAIVEKYEVAIFSLEMSPQQLTQRMLASHARFDLRKMRQGMISPESWTSLQTAAGDLNEAKILIDDSPDLTIGLLRAKARRMKAMYGIRCIFVDYLQLMRFQGRSESRQAEVAEMSRGLKALAKELEVPVVAAAQLNRKPADRPGHRPQMSDLRESGAIEQDADVVMLLHWEDYFHEGEEGYSPTGIRELVVAKQRNGPIGTVPLVFLQEYTRFESAAPGGP